MALAQRLNELAIANSEGLLNDDEYRLLRQNVFEQYSGTNIPVESPLVPITAIHVQRDSTPKAYTSSRIPTSKPIIDQHKPAPDQRPSRAKPSGMAYLIRKATGRKLSAAVHETPLTKDIRAGDSVNVLVNDVSKRSFLVPRLFHKKLAELPLLVTDTSKTQPVSSHFSNTRSENARPPPLSPTGSARRIIPPSPSIRGTVIATISDVFDDDNLTTAKDIIAAIATCEDEGRKLVDAFNDLEASAVRRFQKQNARRMPVTTPNVNVLLDGREWREHRLNPSPSSPVFDFKERHMLNSTDSIGDGMSIRSGSSHKTSLSQAKSISSLRKYPPGSPLSPHSRTPSTTPTRKSSISSMSSQRTSFTSTRILAGTPSCAPSRSTIHLALPKLKRNTESASTESIGLEDGDGESEISDIRRRREELVARYTARLEFLRAKLKGAELHEKLLRK
ncbi:hypothetical protein BYT27DRAFT_7172775 [Phlegmacium glaucopus]|nr:hypothetical protein BYT27DRAFT_7172775 [Phlegmacium glaucopus]